MIKYLSSEEKNLTRNLYKEAFYEDSASFVDYYYTHKIVDNRILADIEEGYVRSMLMLNPYRVHVRGNTYNLDYIVAVATAKTNRRQGRMRTLLEYMFKDMQEKEVPFTFLMPANPGYYTPFGFVYASNKKTTKLLDESIVHFKNIEERDIKEVATFINHVLKSQADVYCIRDEAYIKRELLELSSENGYMHICRNNLDEIIAMRSTWGLEELKERECFAYANISIMEIGSPDIMVRIVNLPAFMKNIRLKPEGYILEKEILLEVIDSQISSNHGIFIWRLNRSGSTLDRVEKDVIQVRELDNLVRLSIEELTQWLFGYKVPPIEGLDDIDSLHGIYINEVV